VNVFFEKLKESGMFFLDEKGFCKKGFVLKLVSNRRDKDKPLKGYSMLYKGLSKL
jgi:hypothetical protein